MSGLAWGMLWHMSDRIRYVLDADALSEEDQVAACRAILNLVEHEVSSFETDLPFSAASEWPHEVVRAATYLSSVKPAGRGENDSYRRTGEVPRSDDAAWAAFLVVAPYAYDAAAWADDGQTLLNFADAASSVIAALTSEQVAQLSETMGADVLITLKEWRKRR